MTRRRTEITVETERLVVAHAKRTTRVWCARCGMEVETTANPEDETPDGGRAADAPEEEAYDS